MPRNRDKYVDGIKSGKTTNSPNSRKLIDDPPAVQEAEAGGFQQMGG